MKQLTVSECGAAPVGTPGAPVFALSAPAHTARCRLALLVAMVLVGPSCATRPSTVRNVTIVEQPTGDSSEATAAAAVRRRSADEFERHTFTVAENQSVVGTLLSMPIGPNETLSDVARHFGLGYEEMAQANPDIDPWVPAANSEVLIPQLFVLPRAARRGIVINLAAMRLFRFKSSDGATQVTTYPVGIGREGKSTPTGTMAIARKTKNPAWYPTKNILADHAKRGDPLPAMVPPGPDNPLGAYAMYLTRPSYLIHGTNKPFSVGLRASNGCIRMYPENIEPLFGASALRDPVQIVNQPYLYGWRGDVLYLQAYPPHEELNPGPLRAAVEADLRAVQDSKSHPLDWDRVKQVLREARGIPIPISQGSPAPEAFIASAVRVAHPQVLYGKPELPSQEGEGWHVLATDTASEITARRVTAVLMHQGPPIPAKPVEVGERYQVIAGPFPDSKAAKLAAHRIRADLELEPRILAPDEQVAGQALPAAMKSAPAPQSAGNSAERSVPKSDGNAGAAMKEEPAWRESIDNGPSKSDAAAEDGSYGTSGLSAPSAVATPTEEARPVGEPTAPVTDEPIWTEAPPADRAAPAAAEEPVDPVGSSPPPAAPETGYTTDDARQSTPGPDPYDARTWPEAEPTTTDSDASSEQEDEKEKRRKEAEAERDPLNLVPLEYPPVIYAPGNSADPIHFIEPGNP
ncbi:L,D-transpeptidase family protein [Methylolobus aquaticus]